MSPDLPTVVTSAGLQPQTPAALNAQLISIATGLAPGLTADLPASMVEDMSSTGTGGLVVIDAARVEAVNSLTPAGANEFLLVQLGQVYGVPQGLDSNTSVYVEFSGSVGFVVPIGFTVSDGTHQYVVQDGGIVETGGSSTLLFCLATQSGSWAVPANSVTQLVTSVPSGITLTGTNPTAGLPSTSAQTEEDYRAQVLQAGVATAQGMPNFTRTQIQLVSGVQARLVSVRQQNGGGWEVIVGGGDPYAVANAIFQGVFDISTLTGSVLSISGITNANPGVVTTTLNHGYTTGQVITITGVVGMSGVNGTPLTITVITDTTFSIGINTTSSGAYVSGGVCSPNLRNISVNINDYPDSYTVPFVNPPQQTVAIDVTWNTSLPNFVNPTAVASAGSPALVDYVNSVPVGQPMNLFVMQETFQQAIANIVPAAFLTRMVFAVSINGTGVSPTSGTGIIAGDPESYFFTVSTDVSIVQG